jgi:hypothetical protein
MPTTMGAGNPETGSLLGTQHSELQSNSKNGSGGMGEVYLAEDLRLKRHVAIKQLFGNATPKCEFQNIRWEARAAAQLNHPGIATVYDLLEVGAHWYIVMEFVQGETLADRNSAGTTVLWTNPFGSPANCRSHRPRPCPGDYPPRLETGKHPFDAGRRC